MKHQLCWLLIAFLLQLYYVYSLITTAETPSKNYFISNALGISWKFYEYSKNTDGIVTNGGWKGPLYNLDYSNFINETQYRLCLGVQ